MAGTVAAGAAGVTDDPTNAARQARFRKARALGYEGVPAGYLPPERAEIVRQWLSEAEDAMREEATAPDKRPRRR